LARQSQAVLVSGLTGLIQMPVKRLFVGLHFVQRPRQRFLVSRQKRLELPHENIVEEAKINAFLRDIDSDQQVRNIGCQRYPGVGPIQLHTLLA